MDISNLIKFAKAGEWQEFCQSWETITYDKPILQKLETVENLLDQIEKKTTAAIQKNSKKWIMWKISNSWEIESNKNQIIELLIDKHLQGLQPDQLIILLKYLWDDGKIITSRKVLAQLLQTEQINHAVIANPIILSCLQHFADPFLTLRLLYHCINFGMQELSLKIYKIFYRQYFENFAIDDEESKLWEDLWKKVNDIKESWYIWEILKIDIGLITDIIIKNKTGLKIPYFRKKRELAQAIVLKNELPTLYATLLKYFANIEQEQLFEQWQTRCSSEKKLQGFKYWDKTARQTLYAQELKKPKEIPGSVLKFEDDDSTQAFTELNIGLEEIERTKHEYVTPDVQVEKTESKIKLHISSLAENVSWKEQLNVHIIHGQYNNALSVILENENNIATDEKNEYELLSLELMLKLKLFQGVLEKLESVWKRVQELETFKAFKYVEAEALWGLNRKREAADCFRKVVDIDPNYKLARWRLVEYSL